MYALITERFKEIVGCLKYLEDIGVRVEPEVIKKALSDLLEDESL